MITMDDTKTELNFVLNGKAVHVTVDSHRRLLDIIREELGLTGTKEGCGVGECGACTVLLDGKPVSSCLMLAAQAQGAEIVTVEGLAQKGKLHPLQQSFLEHGAVQCGFCTPGMLLSAYALLEAVPHPTEAQIKEAIAGNLCRCTGYTQIVAAIRHVAG